jgi:archaellum component FlaF (FlaF/FlaG flagellin family)
MIDMKRLFTVIILSFAVFPAFAQDTTPSDDPYAKFQGIWYGGFDDNEKFIVVFVNSTYMIKTDNFTIGLFTIGEYTINNDTIILNKKNVYDDESGLLVPINPAATITLKYLFSGDKLILATDGNITTFTKM